MTPALRLLPALLLCAWAPQAALAQGAGHAHEHGVSQLDVALDGQQLALVLAGPGYNFVGFEHAPESDEDKRKTADMAALLAKPAQLFTLPPAAQCTPASAQVTPPSHEGHDHDHKDDAKAGTDTATAHGHGKDKDKAHGHSHAAARPAAHDHSHDHSHDKAKDAAPAAQAAGDKAAHADHDHDHDHAHEGHAEWRAEYQFTCAQPQLVKDIALPLFTALPGTQELRVQAITPQGQTGGTITAAQARIVLP
jgi:hypothetical protein